MSSTEAPVKSRGASRARRRRSARGAVLLEAVLVVSVLLLSLIATVYVSRIYKTTLRAVAVSRAAAIGYSNAACDEGDTGSWFSKEEAALLSQAQSDESASPPSTPPVKNEAAQRALSGAVGSGGFASPRTMSTRTGAEVFGPLNDSGKLGGVFSTEVAASDHVLCGEVSHRPGLLGVLGFARDFFKF